MAKFIKCDFHGTKGQDATPLINLDLVQSIKVYQSGTTIVFDFGNNESVMWYFENSETRDLEYNRVLSLLEAK